MNIVQKRYRFGDDFTISKLYADGILVVGCNYILEDKVREVTGIPVEQWKIPCETAIPVGTYVVEKTFSQRFAKMMYQLLDVHGFEGIRLHSGNTSHDTEGCLICGRERDEKNGEVSGSRVARDSLYAKLDSANARGEKITWTVEGLHE